MQLLGWHGKVICKSEAAAHKGKRFDGGDCREKGAVSLNELDVRDWQSLTSWAGLLPFEQRRLLSALKAST